MAWSDRSTVDHILLYWLVTNRDSSKAQVVSPSPHRQRILQPSTDLSAVRNYDTGDLGLVPRVNEHLCTSVDTVRWLSASLNYQMVGRIISRSVATQTPQSWAQSIHHHIWSLHPVNCSWSAVETIISSYFICWFVSYFSLSKLKKNRTALEVEHVNIYEVYLYEVYSPVRQTQDKSMNKQ